MKQYVQRIEIRDGNSAGNALLTLDYIAELSPDERLKKILGMTVADMMTLSKMKMGRFKIIITGQLQLTRKQLLRKIERGMKE